MNIIRKFLGPKSKYDRSLPYTYQARVDILHGEGPAPVYSYYDADTICGLIEYLDQQGIEPSEAQLFGIYLGKEIPLETRYCIDPNGNWLKRPAICRSLEAHFRETLEERYKGHIAEGVCDFDDRDRRGGGPF